MYLLAAVLAGILLLPSCSSNRNVLTEEPAPQETGAGTPPVDGAPPTAAREEIPDEPTLGERLGRLDAQMRVASADSIPILQAEYQELLDQATGAGNIETGGPRRDGGGDSSVVAQEPFAVPSSPRAGRGNDILNSADSTLELKGLRASELRYAAGSGEKVPVAAEPRPAKPHASQPRPRTTASARKSIASAAPVERPARTSTTRARSKSGSQAGAKSFINGVAASRAGWHAEAAAELPRALATSQSAKRRTLAQYSYAQSLENTGKLSQAADQYLKASRSGAGVSHKSYISYCRVLAKSGQKARARQLLVQFIGKNPKSDQVVSARQLLQTL